MEYEFNPKEWVLVRDDDDDNWTLNIFSHKSKDYFYCVSSMWEQCIPYEGNESLLGTSDSPAEWKVGEWKVGDKVEVEYDSDKKWYDGKIVRIDLSRTNWFDNEKMPYYIRSECFKYNDGCAWCAARQLRKPGEKQKEEFKFGDRVEAKRGEGWHEAIFLYNDGGEDQPYKIAFEKFGDVDWLEKEDVRCAC